MQYPQIVLLEEVDDGDVLRLIATSRTNAFKPVEATSTIIDQKAEATFAITELGRIQASFTRTGNASVVGSLYDVSGKLMKTYNYTEARLTISDLADGNFTLVSMGSSRLFNTIYDLAQLPQTGLTEGTDYVLNTVEVHSGAISTVSIEEVPTFDESKLYYTGDNTSFTVNKTSIVAGNYLTLTGRIDFKSAYATTVSNVQMIVDLPESCHFVENSVMVGNSSSIYTLNGNRITIPMTRYTDRVRFCVIPTLGGEYAPSAFVQFDLDSETITQPIGSANFTVKDLSIIVPSVVAKATVPVIGTAVGKSIVDVYENGVIVGQTTALANGSWNLDVPLDNPYNLSTHDIFARITTDKGLVLQSETREVFYNKMAIEPLKVTMINTAHPSNSLNLCEYVTEFVFSNPGKTHKPYWYWPNYPNFTFLVDFTNNDTTVVSNIKLHVLLSDNSIVTLNPTFDKKQNKWVAIHQFDSNALPTNVNVDFTTDSELLMDRGEMDDSEQQMQELCSDAIEEKKEYLDEWNSEIVLENESSFNALYELLSSDNQISADVFKSYIQEIVSTDEAKEYDFDSLMVEIDAQLDSVRIEDETLSNLFTTGLNELFISADEIETEPDEYLYSYESIDGFTTILKTHIPEINEEELLASGYKKIELTDSSAIYYFIDDKTRIYIDSRDLTKHEIRVEVPFSGRRTNRSLDEIGDCIASLESIIHALKDFLNGLKEVNDVAEVRHLLGAASSIIASSIGGLDCLYQSQLAKIEIQIADYINIVKKPLEWRKNSLLSEQAKLHSEINSLSSKCEGLWLSKNNLLQDIENYTENMNSAVTEAEKQNWQKRIDQAKVALANLNSEIIKWNGKLKNALIRAEAIRISIENCIKRIRVIDNIIDSTRGVLKKLPKSISKLRELGHIKITGKVAKFAGIGILATLQIIPIAIDVYDLILELKEWIDLCDTVLAKYPCEGDPLGLQAIMLQTAITGYAHLKAGVNVIKAEVAAMILDYTKHPKAWLLSLGLDLISWAVNELNNKFASTDRERIYAQLNALDCSKKDEPIKWPWWWPFKPVEHVMDPSGYVYEGVASNRLEGVIATALYKEMVEDMYGDLHENIVKWDASEYAQENPLFTDEYGMYAWDVPNGLWQVKFEKEGYETTYSEWLPVPPPQLDINIAMKQNVQPNVKLARAFENAVEVEFDKYMMPELLTEENIRVMQDGEAVQGSVELLNAENAVEDDRAPSETFASKIRFNAAQPFTEQEITLVVSNHVKSYAGIRMQDDYQQAFAIEQEIKQIVSDSMTVVGYGEKATLTVNVLPASASKGKTLSVKTSSPMILGVETEQVVIDNDGKAEITVSGELPGTAALTFSVEGTDKTALTIASVEQRVYAVVAVPTANIASGTVVEKGTKIELSCATEGATIYYTLDGSCPCDNTASRKVYDAPIVINETTTIKAMAAAPDMTESDVIEFKYIVGGSGIEEITINSQIQIYPLPVSDKLNVTAGGNAIKNITISSINGVVATSVADSATKVTLDVSKIPTGIYVINVTTDNGSFCRKILKVK